MNDKTNRYQVIFTCKLVLTVFKETVEAGDSDEAVAKVKVMIREAGLKLDRITAVIQL